MTTNYRMKVDQRLMPLISLGLFIASLTQTALVYMGNKGTGSFAAVDMLLMGSIAILGGGTLEWLIWLANPFYLLSIFYFYRKNGVKSSGYGIFAAVLALLFSSWKQILISESGSSGSIITLKAGYYLWLASIMLMAVISFHYYFQQQKEIQQKERRVSQ